MQALAGRDKERYFVITAIEGKYALICDGKERPVDRQKKKKLIHLKETECCVSLQEVRTNKEFRKVLHRFNYPKQHRKEELRLCQSKT